MDEPALKGLSFVSCIEMIRLKADSFDHFLSGLDEDVRDRCLRLPGANEWVPLRFIDQVMTVAHTHAYAQSSEREFDHGREGIKRDVRGVYAVFVRALSAEFTLRRVSQMWQTYYRGNGVLQVRNFDPAQRFFELQWTGTAMTSSPFWHITAGTIQGVAEVVRLRHVKVRIVEGGPGMNHCICRGDWER